MVYKLYIDGYHKFVGDFDSEGEASRYVAFDYIRSEISVEEAGYDWDTPGYYLVRPDGVKIVYVLSDEYLKHVYDENVEPVSIDPWREELTPLVHAHLLTYGYPHEI